VKPNVGYYLGLALSDSKKRKFCVGKIAKLLLDEKFGCFEELVALGFASSNKFVRDLVLDGTVAAGRENGRLGRRRIIEQAVFHSQGQVRELAFDAYLSIGSTPANEAVLMNRLKEEPYDTEWYGALELLCRLAPTVGKSVPLLCEVLKLQYPPYDAAKKAQQAIAQYRDPLIREPVMSLLKSPHSFQVVRGLEIFCGIPRAPDAILTKQIRKLRDTGRGRVEDLGKVVMVKYSL